MIIPCAWHAGQRKEKKSKEKKRKEKKRKGQSNTGEESGQGFQGEKNQRSPDLGVDVDVEIKLLKVELGSRTGMDVPGNVQQHVQGAKGLDTELQGFGPLLGRPDIQLGDDDPGTSCGLPALLI